MKKYFTIEEKVLVKYNCELPYDFKGSPKEFAKKYGLKELFEHSLHEKVIEYTNPDIDSIKEL